MTTPRLELIASEVAASMGAIYVGLGPTVTGRMSANVERPPFDSADLPSPLAYAAAPTPTIAALSSHRRAARSALVALAEIACAKGAAPTR